MRSIFLFFLLVFSSFPLGADVSRIIIEERGVVADSLAFGATGLYEKIRGRVVYQMDPSNPANAKIVDLPFAKTDGQGRVECTGTFLLLKPVDMSRANGRLLYGVNNRGNLYILRNLNDAGHLNPLLEKKEDDLPLMYNYIMGISQSGRFIAHMLYQGFHVDEKGRQVVDGARIHVAGGGKGEFNHRFARPTHHPSDLEGNYMPADFPPFVCFSENAAGSGGPNDLLAKAKRLGQVPKIIITNHALEYWTRSASLIHTTLGGKQDAAIHDHVRIYMLNGAPHGTPWRWRNPVAEHLLSSVDVQPFMRSTLVLLDEWVSQEIEPPPSRYPRLDNQTLISPQKHRAQMPPIPGLRHPGRNLRPPICDYGPDFRTQGIISRVPPRVTGHYPTFVPAVDEDGNGRGGIRMPEVAAPLGTYQGFNPRRKEVNAPNYLNRFYGSFWPFAVTREERQKTGDPRLSLEERFGGHEGYVRAVTQAATRLMDSRLLLKEDAEAAIQKAETISWPPQRLETWPFWK